MAYPLNIAPQTPSTRYNVVNISTTTTGADKYVLLRNLTFSRKDSIKSSCMIDLPFYDASTVRDIVGASEMGRSPVSLVSYKNVTGVYVGEGFTNNGDAIYVEQIGSSDSFTPAADEIATMMQQSDPFAHVPPHQNVLGRTMIEWWDGPVVMGAVSGNLVGRCWADQFVDEGSSVPQFIGAAPPADPGAS